MTKRNRNALIITGIIVVIVGVWAGSIAASFDSAGIIRVDVRSADTGGDHVSVRIPAATVMGVLAFVPNEVFCEATDECGEYMPLVRALCDELQDLPDFTLVEVEERNEHVRIRTEGNTLRIDVEDRDEIVHLSIPLGIVEQVAKKIEKGRSII
jgi:hypothetical protein